MEHLATEAAHVTQVAASMLIILSAIFTVLGLFRGGFVVFKYVQARRAVVDVEAGAPAVFFVPPVLVKPPAAATQFFGPLASYGGGYHPSTRSALHIKRHRNEFLFL
ncbi:hypothetical protein C8R44DRAFT_885173 [Mycena epipterygia]|nr:hypothetical protein C8R44DRAFT_885173 [Mycena epipterygia]